MDETQRSAQRAKSVAERLGATDVDLWIFSPRSPDVLLDPQKFSVLMQTIRMQMRGQLFCVDCDELINEPTDIGVVAYMTAARRESELCGFACCEACAARAGDDLPARITKVVGVERRPLDA